MDRRQVWPARDSRCVLRNCGGSHNANRSVRGLCLPIRLASGPRVRRRCGVSDRDSRHVELDGRGKLGASPKESPTRLPASETRSRRRWWPPCWPSSRGALPLSSWGAPASSGFFSGSGTFAITRGSIPRSRRRIWRPCRRRAAGAGGPFRGSVWRAAYCR